MREHSPRPSHGSLAGRSERRDVSGGCHILLIRRGSRDFELVFWDLDPPPGGILRLAFAPGHHRLRVALLNCVIKKPVVVEVEVQDGKVLPVRVRLTEAGTTVVETKEQERGGTAFGRYGRRTKFGSEEMVMTCMRQLGVERRRRPASEIETVR